LEIDLQRINFRLHFMTSLHELLEVLFEKRRIERGFVRRFRDCLPGVLCQFRFRIERLHVAHAADEKNPNHRFRLRREIGLAELAGGGFAAADNPLLVEERPESQPGAPHAEIGEKCSAGSRWRRNVAVKHGYLSVTKSL